MTDDLANTQFPTSDAPPSPAPSARAEARAAAKARRLKKNERREARFAFFAPGWTPHEIAKVLKVSAPACGGGSTGRSASGDSTPPTATPTSRSRG